MEQKEKLKSRIQYYCNVDIETEIANKKIDYTDNDDIDLIFEKIKEQLKEVSTSDLEYMVIELSEHFKRGELKSPRVIGFIRREIYDRSLTSKKYLTISTELFKLIDTSKKMDDADVKAILDNIDNLIKEEDTTSGDITFILGHNLEICGEEIDNYLYKKYLHLLDYINLRNYFILNYQIKTFSIEKLEILFENLKDNFEKYVIEEKTVYYDNAENGIFSLIAFILKTISKISKENIENEEQERLLKLENEVKKFMYNNLKQLFEISEIHSTEDYDMQILLTKYILYYTKKNTDTDILIKKSLVEYLKKYLYIIEKQLFEKDIENDYEDIIDCVKDKTTDADAEIFNVMGEIKKKKLEKLVSVLYNRSNRR